MNRFTLQPPLETLRGFRPPRMSVVTATALVLMVYLFSPAEPARMQGSAPGGVSSGLALWLKANAGTNVDAAGNFVSPGWLDQSGNGRNADIVSSDPQRVAGPNFNPAVFFDGGDVLSFSSSPFVSTFTAGEVFTVARSANGTVTNNNNPYDFGGTGNSHYVYGNDNVYNEFATTARFSWNTKTRIVLEGKAPYVSGSTVNGPPLEPRAYHIFATHSATNDWGVHLDGFDIANATTNTVGFALTGTNERLGASGGGGWVGEAPEYILYNRTLTALERQKVNTYLGIKYGIPQFSPAVGAQDYVTSAGTVIWQGTANAAYHNSVAGIGRDDGSALDQRQAQSVNRASPVVIGFGNTIAADNASHPGGLADQQFLVWGDNGASHLFETSITPPGGVLADRRMARAWRVDETGSIGSVKVAVPAGKANFGLVYLVVSNDDTFDSTDQWIQLTSYVSGSTAYVATDFDLSDGQYFTFASTAPPSVAPGSIAANLKLWLRADADVTGTSPVTIWGDQSGRGNDATIQIGTASQNLVASAINFNPAVSFMNNGGLQGLLDVPVTSNTASAFVVMKPRSALNNAGADGNGRAFSITEGGRGDSDNSASALFFYKSGKNLVTHRNGGNLSSAVNVYDKVGVFASHFKVSNQQVTVYGGAPQTPVAQTAWAFYSDRFNVGAHQFVPGNEFLGEIAEILLYDADQAAAGTEARIASYLALKYGVTLSHNYVASDGTTTFWDVAANTGYNNNIAGIGRDDASALVQRQSRSQSSNLVTMGLGTTIAAANVSNTASFAADKQFLMWGDNGASDRFQTPITPPAGVTADRRMPRVWRIDETSTIGSVKVAAPAGIGNLAPAYLIVSNDATFDSADQWLPMTSYTEVGGGTPYVAADFDFSDGQYFTFASAALPAPGGAAANLKLWLKADADVTGTPVTAWGDQSGRGNDATTPMGVPAQTLVGNALNFNPVVRFNGTSGLQGVLDAPLTSNNASAFMVMKPRNRGGCCYPRAFSVNLDGWFDHGVFESGIFFLTRHTSVASHRAGAFLSTVTNGTEKAGVFATHFKTGNQTVTVYGGTPFPAGAQTTVAFNANRFNVGTNSRNEWTEMLLGDIAEIVLYDADQAAAGTEPQIASYLALKYGVTLSHNYLASNGTAVWSLTTNTGYNNNIAGIGRDDTSALDQRQSRSVNTTAGTPSTAPDIVTIGHGTIATDNPSNPNAFVADRSFLVWGDNSASTLLTNTIAGAPIADLRRMSRVWRVQESGSVASVRVRAELTAILGSNRHLVRSMDPTFASGNTFVSLTTTASGHEGTTDFATGEYFTFAAVPPASPGGVSAGLNLWLRADAGTNVNASNNFVTGSGWQDQSGYGRHADAVYGDPQLQTSAAKLVNFNPTVDFDGNDYLRFSKSPFANKFTAGEVFSVVKDSSPNAGNNGHPFDFGGHSSTAYTNADNRIWEDFGTNDRVSWFPATGVLGSDADSAKAGVSAVTGLPVNTGLYHIYSAHSAANDWGVRFDGFTALASTTNTVSFALAGGNEHVAARSGAVWHGLMPEVFLYERTLTETERQQVNSYLGVKYGITQLSPSAGPQDYVTSAGTTTWNGIANGGYHANVAGIGRDDKSALSQKQSKNIEPGSFVAMSVGPFAVTNPANTGTLADQSFLVWGHDPGALSVSVDVTGGLYRRMARVWRAQETGTVGPVVVRIPYGYLSGRSQTLVRSVDAVFTDADPRIPLVRNGQFYEATVDFGAVEFFTFAVIPYEPGGVGGEALWVKANDGLLTDIDNDNATQVTEWLDQSGSGNTTTELRASLPAHTDLITPSTDIVHVPVGINFNAAVKFTGASGKSLKGNAAGDWDSGPLSIFAIALREGAPAVSPAALFSANGSWEGNAAGVGLIANSTTYGLDGVGCGTALTTSTITQPRLARGVYTTAGNGNGGGTWLDGKVEGTGTSCATSATTFFEVGGRTSASGTNNNRIFNGKIAEVVVYKGVLSAADTNKVESYLGLKYGITLDQTSARNYVDGLGATIWDATLNATYKNNIAGIGRDDLSGLDQRQSRSSGPGDFVTVGLGTIAADNPSNTNLFAADKTFLIWGHDGTSASWGTTVPSTLLRRVQRVWRAQETGTVASVIVRIPRALVGVQNPVLLRSVDATFDSGDTQVPMTVNGVYLQATIDFATGDYFTFASESAPAPLNAGDGLVTEGHIKGMVLNTPVCPAYPWQHAPRTTAGLTGGLTGSPVGTVVSNESTWVVDANGDSIPDLVHARENEGIAVWTGNGDGTFALNAITTSITSTFTVGHTANETTFLGDINGDAAIDLLSVTDGAGVAANSGTRAWLGNGDGTFATTPIVDVGTFTGTVGGTANIMQAGYSANESTFLADINNDGRMDIVWVYDGNGVSANSGVWSWLGNGDGTFNHTPLADAGAFTGTFPVGGSNIIQAGTSANDSTHIGDFNSDGRLDLLWVYSQTSATSGTWFWAGNGDGTFSHTPVVDQGSFVNGPGGIGGIASGNGLFELTRTADVNNDGRLDVVWTGPSLGQQSVFVWLGQGDGTFAHTPIADGGGFVALTVGVSATADEFIVDLNGDGALDFLYVAETGATARAYLAVDGDGDGIGDLVDTDDDNDGIADTSDSCPVPGSIGTGLQLWLKADTGATVDSSNNFLHWADQSTFARDANVLNGDPQRIDAALSFNPTVRLDGNDYFRFGKSPFVTGFTAGEVFTVVRNNATAAPINGFPYDFGSGSRGSHYTHTTGGGSIYDGFGTTDRLAWNPTSGAISDAKAGVGAITGPTFLTQDYHLYSGYSAAGDWGVSVDGTVRAVTTTNTVNFGLTASNEAIGHNGTDALTGDVAEVILYNRTLSAVEREEVNSYLGTKYGITIGHSYRASDDTTIYWDMAANAAYHNSVAGLGRDDGATLNQRQSISINPGSFVAMGLATLAADNPSHPNSFATDLTFMMWGDNNASAGFDAVIAGPAVGMVNRRMSRVWKIQETNTVGSVMLGIPDSIGTGNTVYLVVSNDETFDGSDIWMPLTGFAAGAASYLSTNVDFTNGQFFTFATMIHAPGGVTGMALWVKANDGPSTTSDGSNVATWADRSGASKDLSVLDDTKDVQPTYKALALNFNPAVSLLNDATSDQGLVNLSFLGDDDTVNYNIDGSLFFAHIPRKTTDCNTLAQLALPGSDHPSMGHCASNGNQLFGANDYPVANTTWSSGAGLTAPPDVPALSGYTWRYNAAGSFFFRNNGAAVANATVPSHSGRDFYLMRDADDNVSDGAGDMSEAVMYTRQLTALENQKVDSYLAIKYGVTLNQSTPANYLSSTNRVIWNATTAGAYNQNIAGIGRDDASALVQRQSQSVNVAGAGSLVTIGLGTIAVDNVSNANAFAADDSFLVWSDDGLPATFTGPIVTPAGSTESRMLRTWFAQESGVVGVVRVGLPFGTGAGAPVYLVVSNDPVFDGADSWRVMTPHAAGTVSYLAADVDVASGQYFTFATVTPEDYGDAPASYATTAAANGPRHAIAGYDIVTGGASLMLGPRIDAELDGAASATSSADDTAGADDEDGVAFPPLSAGAAASLTVTVTNSGPAARLNAWADWNGNGSFADAGEQIATDLAVSAGANAVNVNVPPGAVGTVIFRFRLSTQTGLAPTGAAPDGEVEDYQVALGAAETRLTITKTDGQTSYVPGATIAYTIRVTNAGPANASGISIADNVPASIAGLSVSCVTTGSASCGTNATAGNNVSFTGASVTAGAGSQITLTIQGTVSTSANGPLTNTAAVALGPSQTDSDTTDNTAVDIDTQAPSETNLELTKTGPATVMVGENVTYIITVTNHGPSVATNVVVTDPTPAGLTFLGTGTGCTTAFPCALGSMAPGEIRQISATYRVEPGYPTATPIQNTASVSGTEADSTPGNNSQLATTTALPTADVEVRKTVNNSTPLVGQTVTFTVTVQNHGPSDSTGIEVRDLLPSELTFVSATPSQGAYNPTTGLWTVGAVAQSTSVTMTLTATVNAPGTVTNLAVKTAQTEPDSRSGNDSGGATLTGAPSADIWVDKAIDRSTALVGENVTFTVTVTNRGPSAATNVAIDDALPAGLAMVSATPSQGTYNPTTGVWTVGSMTATGQATLTMVATLTQAGALVNQASVRSSDQHDPDGLNNTFAASVNAQANADILVTKTVSNTAPAVGATVTYTVAATNLGPSEATVVEVFDVLPAGLAFVSASPSQGTYDETTGMWSVGALAHTATAILTIRATVTQAGVIDNTAVLQPGAPVDPNADNDDETATITAGREADLGITKTPSSPTVTAGSALSWTIVVTNTGPSPVTGASVTDLFDAAFLSPTWTCVASAGSSCAAASGTGNIATTVSLLAGGTATFTATGIVDPAATALSNTATAWPPADTTDPLTGDNSAVSTVTVGSSADVGVGKTGPAETRPGTAVTYTITVTNAGPSSAAGVTLDDPTPAGLVPVSVAGACSAFPCALGTLAANTVHTVTATYNVPVAYSGAEPISNTATVTSSTSDPNVTNNAATATTALRRGSCDVNGDGLPEFVTGAGPGGGPHVRIWQLTGGVASELYGFFAYDGAFPGGVTVACGDVTGDGVAEIITGAGGGGGPHVRVWHFNGMSVDEVAGWFAYDPAFGGGVKVAAGDVTGDGIAEIITGAGPGGGPHVRIWSLAGGSLSELYGQGYFGYDGAFAGGVFLGTGDVDGDGVDELLIGPGETGPPQVRVWSLLGGGATERASFMAYPAGFTGGVTVAAADLDGDGVAELVTGAGPTGGPHVRMWRVTGSTVTEIFGFFAYDPAFPGGVHVASGDVDGDGVAEIITGAGRGGGPHVRIWKPTPTGLIEVTGFFAYHPAFPGGVFVGR
jgi:uncharacterized repeat protein (TIGR01451 family)